MMRVALLALAVTVRAQEPLTDLEVECHTIDDAELYRCWNEKYGEDSNTDRFPVFQANLAAIRKHNALQDQSYTMEPNEFATLTSEEFAAIYLGAPQDCSATGERQAVRTSSTLPDSIDWRTKGIVTAVKNQGSCGSCWTFSTTGVVESHYALATKKLVPLSEQQLVDCAGAFKNHGCGGGLPSQAMEYIHYSGGLEGETDYPYKAKNQKCTFDKTKVVARVAEIVNITEKDEASMLTAVGTIGPVSIAFACHGSFHSYKSGVWDSNDCPSKPSQVNHAVLAVGYGTDNGKDYWLVKNSWKATWGEKGYFRIARGKNLCGLADCASYPVMQKTGSIVI